MVTRATRRLVCLCLLASALASAAWAQRVAPPLAARIRSPGAGVVDERLSVHLDAEVSPPSVSTARLDVNGVAREVRVSGGRVAQEIAVLPGVNRVVLSVARGAATARASTTFFVRCARSDLRVVMTWVERGVRLAPQVLEPGEAEPWTVWSGGSFETRGEDGLRMSAGLITTARAGRYAIGVELPVGYDGAEPSQPSWNESIERLDTIDRSLATVLPARRAALVRERNTVLAALDAWATPLARRIVVHVDVVLFAGAAGERRWRFDRALVPVGASAELGAFEVTDAMIRAAHPGDEAP